MNDALYLGAMYMITCDEHFQYLHIRPLKRDSNFKAGTKYPWSGMNSPPAMFSFDATAYIF